MKDQKDVAGPGYDSVIRNGHKACENTYFSECRLQLFVANLQSEICSVALSRTHSAGLWNPDSLNPASMQVSTDL